jgi:ATP/maltotriose-dependent transcriptional regulator MalT
MDSEFKIAETSNPLGILALESFNSLNEENKRNLLKLGIVEEFDLEVAAIILGQDFSETYINKLATDGMFVSVSSGTQRKFTMNPIVYQVLQERRAEYLDQDIATHKKLADYYVSIGSPTEALEHIFQSGSQTEVTEMLRVSIRDMAAVGRGDQILRWAQYGADDSPQGELMKKSIQVVAHMVNLDFQKSEALVAELDFVASQNPQLEFLTQITAMIMSHVYFARGDFERSRVMITKALAKDYEYTSIENVDKIALLRLQADIAYIYDDGDLITSSLNSAKKIQDGNNLTITGYHIGCMTAMLLWSQGRFFEAAEFASIAITQAENNGFSGITGPFDALLVLSRCQLELSKLEKSIETSNVIEQKAESSQIWPWYFMAVGCTTYRYSR